MVAHQVITLDGGRALLGFSVRLHTPQQVIEAMALLRLDVAQSWTAATMTESYFGLYPVGDVFPCHYDRLHPSERVAMLGGIDGLSVELAFHLIMTAAVAVLVFFVGARIADRIEADHGVQAQAQ